MDLCSYCLNISKNLVVEAEAFETDSGRIYLIILPPPTQDGNRHHQDYEFFGGGIPT